MRQLLHLLVLLKRYALSQLQIRLPPHLAMEVAATDICVDIGAHCGAWTWPLSRLVPKGRVYAVEAFPYYARMLQRMCRLLRRSNVSVCNCAATQSLGSARLVWRNNRGERLTGFTHLAGAGESAQDTIEIQCRPLTTIVPPHEWTRVRFIKCDVEGAELQVFKGATEILAKAKPMVFCEVCDDYCRRYGNSARDVFEYFEGLGFRAFAADSSQKAQPITAQECAHGRDVWFVHQDERW